MAINPEQKRYLTTRLQEARSEKPGRHVDVKKSKPLAVKAAEREVAKARRVIERWGNQMKAARERRNDAVLKSFRECQEAILFGDAKKALKLLEAFEAKKF